MKHSLVSPKPGGAFADASAAFTRLHVLRETEVSVEEWEKRERAAGNWFGSNGASKIKLEEGQTHRTIGEWVPKTHLLTKFNALVTDLRALRDQDPNMRVVIFTEYDEVQERLVDMLRPAKVPSKDNAAVGTGIEGLQIFEFNAKTKPVTRHKRIKNFQGGSEDGAKVFVVTYRTAAVGITLTAANRVYLFEPALDPAQEVQAAGRIHRLGQTKEVNVLAI